MEIKPNKTLPPRKTSSGFTFAVYDSVSMINADHWNQVVIFGSEFLKLNYLGVLEKSLTTKMRFHYAIVYANQSPVAIAYFQVIDFSAEGFGNVLEDSKDENTCRIIDRINTHLSNYIKRSADRINMRLLICGNAFISGEHGFASIPDFDKTLAMDALADVIYRIGKAEKLRGKIAAVLVKDFYKTSKNYSERLEEYKYHTVLVEPNMEMNIEWKNFDEYLNAISKKYRNRAKSIVKKGIELERKIFSSEEISTNAKQIQKLYDNVHLKATFRLASLSPEYFAAMKKEMNNKFSFIAYYFQEKLIGFRTSFVLKDSIEAHFIGLDYNLNKQLDLYQNILFDYLKEAIDKKVSYLYLGRTASEIKSTLGAKAHELTCYVRHRNPISNHIIKPFTEYLKPTDWVPRNPFKEED